MTEWQKNVTVKSSIIRILLFLIQIRFFMPKNFQIFNSYYSNALSWIFASSIIGKSVTTINGDSGHCHIQDGGMVFCLW